jgi:hypothetical protein
MRIDFLVTTACLALLAVSCASFPAGKLPLATDLPKQAGASKKPSVHFDVQYLSEISAGTRPPEEIVEMQFQVEEIIERLVDEASIFDARAIGSIGAPLTADYILQIKVTNFGNERRAQNLALITCYTFGLVPIAVSDNYVMEVALLDRRGKSLKNYHYEDEIKTRFGIWFLPVSGKSPKKAWNSVLENMIRTLLRDVLVDDVLPYSP